MATPPPSSRTDLALQDELIDKDEELKVLRLQVSYLKDTVDRQRKTEEANQALAQRVKTLEEDNAALSVQLEQLVDTSRKEIQREADKYQQRVRELEQDREAVGKAIKDANILQQDRRFLAGELEKSVAEVAKLQAEKQGMQDAVEELCKQVEDLAMRLQDAEERLINNNSGVFYSLTSSASRPGLRLVEDDVATSHPPPPPPLQRGGSVVLDSRSSNSGQAGDRGSYSLSNSVSSTVFGSEDTAAGSIPSGSSTPASTSPPSTKEERDREKECKKFQEKFRLPPEEVPLHWYSCSGGSLYITPQFLAHESVTGDRSVLRLADILEIRKSKGSILAPLKAMSLTLTVKSGKSVTFMGLIKRDTAVASVLKQCAAAGNTSVELVTSSASKKRPA